MTYQVRIDFYPIIGIYATPDRKTETFKNKKEALKFYKESERKYESDKNGYGRIVLLLRKVQFKNGNKNHVDELERLKFRIIK